MDAHSLLPDTDYQVAVRVHNGSNHAPAFGVVVRLSYHLWGTAGTWTSVGQTEIDLPVRGAPREPVTVLFDWHTPDRAGHWCLDAELEYPDDLNPLNNLGQTNVDIRRARPGDAVSVDIPIRHSSSEKVTLQLRTTSYSLPEKPLYPPAPEGALARYDSAVAKLGEQPSLRDLIAACQSTGQPSVDNWSAYLSPAVIGRDVSNRTTQYGEHWLPRITEANAVTAHWPPASWQLSLSANELTLAANEEVKVRLRLQVPSDTPVGTRKSFQVNAFEGERRLVGGVEVLLVIA